MSSFSESAIRAGTTGVVAKVGSMVLMPDEVGDWPFMGVNFEVSNMIGVCAAGGAVTADLAHNYLLPHIQPSKKWQNLEATLLGAGASGIGTAAMVGITGGNPNAWMKAGGIGAASYLAGDYLATKLFGNAGMVNLF